eukprot:6200641-Pleurochrysis_carterae.AAC.2
MTTSNLNALGPSCLTFITVRLITVHCSPLPKLKLKTHCADIRAREPLRRGSRRQACVSTRGYQVTAQAERLARLCSALIRRGYSRATTVEQIT